MKQPKTGGDLSARVKAITDRMIRLIPHLGNKRAKSLYDKGTREVANIFSKPGSPSLIPDMDALLAELEVKS